MKFQFTRPRGARRLHWIFQEIEAAFQFTRPRGARQRRLPPRDRLQRVSIHAPARGATPSRRPTSRPTRRFNSRARKGRDTPLYQSGSRRESFNSRARKGRDGLFNAFADARRRFQFTRPQGARHKRLPGHDRPRVSIHAPARGATTRLRIRGRTGEVSIHAPARGATGERLHKGRGGRVSIHAPARGATRPPPQSRSRTACFNSRAREGRDIDVPLLKRIPQVSIHAPARGATRGTRGTARLRSVSIHAPARGATSAKSTAFAGGGFQFTRPRGARQVSIVRFHAIFVSIHAPARGATGGRRASSARARGFNSRAREGRDAATSASRASATRFNSRAREGRDAANGEIWLAAEGFQFTRPRGARRRLVEDRRLPGVSIHAPARGATRLADEHLQLVRVSIHAPARGATLRPSAAAPRGRVSIHAPARGATAKTARRGARRVRFNSRAREGRDA